MSVLQWCYGKRGQMSAASVTHIVVCRLGKTNAGLIYKKLLIALAVVTDWARSLIKMSAPPSQIDQTQSRNEGSPLTCPWLSQ